MRLGADIVILSAARSPFGKFGGALKDLTATDMGVHAARAAIQRAGIAADKIDHVVFGNALQTSLGSPYLARHIGLTVGIPISVPALVVNRLCGSGFQSIISGAELLMLDEANFVVAGGVESMSQAPHVIRGARWGMALGAGKLEDFLSSSLTDGYCDLSMAMTAEKVAERYGISRAQADQFAYLSQQRTHLARQCGYFNDEIAPITRLLEQDEHPRPDTSIEALATLKPVFKRDGVVTAGNASGICDGASAVILTTAENARMHDLKPLAKIVSWGIVGCDPAMMGLGPVWAIRKALERGDLTLDQMGLIEVNEAFAAQYLAVEKELGLDRDKVNVNGGAIAIGHPLGATGSRIVTTMVYELKRRGARYGIGSACIGGGQGIALVVENLAG